MRLAGEMEWGRPASYEAGWIGRCKGVRWILRDERGLRDDEMGGVEGVCKWWEGVLLPAASGGVRGPAECIGETLIWDESWLEASIAIW